jgi:hypothetical protein
MLLSGRTRTRFNIHTLSSFMPSIKIEGVPQLFAGFAKSARGNATIHLACLNFHSGFGGF